MLPVAAWATHFDGAYHYTGEDCPVLPENRVDPITNVFTREATSYNTSIHINHHTGWGFTDVGATQYFQFETSCDAMNNQRADRDYGDRYHIRWRQSPYYSFEHGYITTADPHHEDLARCFPPKHAVDQNGPSGSGFDQGRATIYQSFVGTHHTYGGTGNWGNTELMPQCDGGWAGSNGNVGFWWIGG
jgi:hypothetical protein